MLNFADFFVKFSVCVQGLYRLILLRKLTASDNEITRLSNDIGQLVSLQELDVSRNGTYLAVYIGRH